MLGNGEVFGWGNTEYGQLTSDSEGSPQITSPRNLDFLKDCGKIVDIAAGGSYCLVLNGLYCRLNERSKTNIW